MSIGNTKTQGNKGNNFPYQLGVLKLLEQVVAAPACCPTAATESTLQSVLSALQNGQSFLTALVSDTGGVGCPTACPTYTAVSIWNGVAFDPPIYYDAQGNVVVPVGPVIYINPQYVLEQIYVILQSTNAYFIPQTRTPSLLRVTGAGLTSVPANARSVSFYNAGNTDASVAGGILKQGEQVSFEAGGQGDLLGAIAYDALTTELVISKIV